MRWTVVNRIHWDKVNCGKVVQFISDKKLRKWRLDRGQTDVPISDYLILPWVKGDRVGKPPVSRETREP